MLSSAPEQSGFLSCSSLSYNYAPNVPCLKDISVTLPANSFTAIVGPNGSGKSTFLLCLARQLRFQGEVEINGVDAKRLSRKEFARQLAFLPQNPIAPEGITVRGLVERGRTPHRRGWASLSTRDEEIIERNIQELSLSTLEKKGIYDISGGQRQRAWLAMVLAQDTSFLLLDEPTAFLDLAHQTLLLNILQDHARAGGTVVAVLHDINLATAFADEMVVMNHGTVVAQGKPSEVISIPLLEEVFSLAADIIHDPLNQAPVILPRSLTQKI